MDKSKQQLSSNFIELYWPALLITVMSIISEILLGASAIPIALTAITATAWGVMAFLNSRNNTQDVEQPTQPEPVAVEAIVVPEPVAAPAPPPVNIIPQISGITGEVGLFLRNESSSIQDKSANIRDIIKDAITNLNNSFNNLNDHTQQEHDVVVSLIESLAHSDGSSNSKSLSFQQLSKETTQVMEKLVSQLSNVGQRSTETVGKIDEMVGQIEAIFTLLVDVKSIADQTNLLALNAAKIGRAHV